MKVSFFDDEPEIYPLQYGGKARFIVGLATALAKRSDIKKVSILSRTIRSSKKEFQYKGVIFRRLDDNEIIQGIQNEANKTDILNVHSCSFTFPVLEKKKACIIYHLHDVMFTNAERGGHLDKALSGKWDAIISPSDFATNTLTNYSKLLGIKNNIHTLPRGLDASLFSEVGRKEATKAIHALAPSLKLEDHDYPILFFPNRPNTGKGEEFLGGLAKSLREKFPNCLIITAADQARKNYDTRIVGVGWIKSENLKYFYSISDLTLNFSKLPESFSQITTESIACSTPVICFGFGNLSDLSKQLSGVIICRPQNEDIHRAVIQTLSDTKVDKEKIHDFSDSVNGYVKLCKDLHKVKGISKPLKSNKVVFISPNVFISKDELYVSDDIGEVRHLKLTARESTILSNCRDAVTIEELCSITKLSPEAIVDTVQNLRDMKILIGG